MISNVIPAFLNIEKLESVESESVIESKDDTHSGIENDLLRFGVSFGCALHFNLRIEECDGVVTLEIIEVGLYVPLGLN